MDVMVLHESELRELVGIDQASLDCIAECYGWLHDGRAMVPPVAHIVAADQQADVDIKTAYVSGVDTFTVKIASGFPRNVERGLPSGSGMMVVFSAETGFCEAVLLDNGYLTALRTGLAGAVAADRLAPGAIDTVGIIGAGVQARFQLRSLALVRDFKRVVVWDSWQEGVPLYVDEMRSQDQFDIEAAGSAEEVVRQSDLLVTATPSRSPLVHAEWLRPGQHITAVGADFPGKRELDPAVLERADRLFCDRLEQSRRLGELQHWRGDRPLQAVELGAVIRGAAPGRRDDSEITVCDLTGVGVQDTAIADRACAMARLKGRA